MFQRPKAFFIIYVRRQPQFSFIVVRRPDEGTGTSMHNNQKQEDRFVFGDMELKCGILRDDD